MALYARSRDTRVVRDLPDTQNSAGRRQPRASSSYSIAIARIPRRKLSTLIHSSGAWAFSPGSPKPTSSTGALSIRSKSPTTGIEPPSPMVGPL